MNQRATGRRRTKVSLTVDPRLLKAVDSYIQRHQGMDRSKVMDAALTVWYAAKQEQAMIEQFRSPEPAEVQAERQEWKRIRRAAAGRRVRRTSR